MWFPVAFWLAHSSSSFSAPLPKSGPSPLLNNMVSLVVDRRLLRLVLQDVKPFQLISKDFPSVLPAPDFDPLVDAKALRAAMKGLGTDDQVLIGILCQRSNGQRQYIMEQYGCIVLRPLIADLKNKLSGNFKKVITGLMFSTNQYCAKQLHRALKGIAGVKEDLLVEILCSRSYEETAKIAAAYESLYGTALIMAVKKGTSGTFQKLLTMTLQKMTDQANGYGDYAYDPVKAEYQAITLYKAAEQEMNVNVNAFVDILGFATQRRRQTTMIFHSYEKISGKTIEHAIKSKMCGAVLNGLLAIVKTVHNRPAYFAERLNNAIKGWVTDNDTLIRIILSRCEIDLINITYEYERRYGKTLFDAVKEDTSGFYRRSLLTLIGIEPLCGLYSSSCSSCSSSCGTQPCKSS